MKLVNVICHKKYLFKNIYRETNNMQIYQYGKAEVDHLKSRERNSAGQLTASG